MLRWTAVGSGEYRIFESPPGSSIYVTGTGYTPRPQPGKTVSYSVEATHSQSAWSNTVTITYLAPSTPLPPTAEPLPPQPPSTPQPLGVPGNWHLVFDDEFNGGSLDTSKWNTTVYSYGGEPWAENETCTTPSRVSEPGDGYVHLTLTKETNTCANGGTREYTGGLISSDPAHGPSGHVGFDYRYGYVEWRAYFPAASAGQIANWPGLWSIGTECCWPEVGENDTAEGLLGNVEFHFHSNAGAPGGGPGGDYTGWHTYASNWQPGMVTYYYDGKEVGQITQGITSQRQYLIANVGTGGFGGPLVVPSEILIDYVRVWQAAPPAKQGPVVRAAFPARAKCSLRLHKVGTAGHLRLLATDHLALLHRGRRGAADPRTCRRRIVARRSKRARRG